MKCQFALFKIKGATIKLSTHEGILLATVVYWLPLLEFVVLLTVTGYAVVKVVYWIGMNQSTVHFVGIHH